MLKLLHLENVLKDREDNWYIKPQNVDGVILDPVSGFYTSDDNGSLFYFLKGTEPIEW